MKWSEKTTAEEILEFFNISVFELLESLGDMYDGWKDTGMESRLIAVKTRKKLFNWFEAKGGL